MERRRKGKEENVSGGIHGRKRRKKTVSYGRLTLESWLDSELWQTNTWELEVSEFW